MDYYLGGSDDTDLMSVERRKRALSFLLEKFFIAEAEGTVQDFKLEEDGMMTACIACISFVCIAVLSFALHRSGCIKVQAPGHADEDPL